MPISHIVAVCVCSFIIGGGLVVIAFESIRSRLEEKRVKEEWQESILRNIRERLVEMEDRLNT